MNCEIGVHSPDCTDQLLCDLLLEEEWNEIKLLKEKYAVQKPIVNTPTLPYTEVPYGIDVPWYTKDTLNSLTSAFEVLDTLTRYGPETAFYRHTAAIGSLTYSLGKHCSLSQLIVNSILPVWLDSDKQLQLHYLDIWCNTCDCYVSHLAESDHWEDLCGNCNEHSDMCECCATCDSYPCECCELCGHPRWDCTCCEYCGESEDYCECVHCDDCGYINCSCLSGTKFGSIKVCEWERRSAPSYPVENVPSMQDVENDQIDPIQAAADFYLLSAMSDFTRAKEADWGNTDTSEFMSALNLLAAERPVSSNNRILNSLYHDDALVQNMRIAKRAYRAHVVRIDRSFLGYTIAACGGELRYHRAVKSLSSSRNTAWNQFIEVIEQNGADVLFDAVDLFEDFGSYSYGGTNWAKIAKVGAMRLSGQISDWMFVDRIITLQHNGGCVLNKVTWAYKNGLGLMLDSMQSFLNAHSTDTPDWGCLLKAASPEVSQLWHSYERALNKAIRRNGGFLPPVHILSKSHYRYEYSS